MKLALSYSLWNVCEIVVTCYILPNLTSYLQSGLPVEGSAEGEDEVLFEREALDDGRDTREGLRNDFS